VVLKILKKGRSGLVDWKLANCYRYTGDHLLEDGMFLSTVNAGIVASSTSAEVMVVMLPFSISLLILMESLFNSEASFDIEEAFVLSFIMHKI
jgi:hypothetical protein